MFELQAIILKRKEKHIIFNSEYEVKDIHMCSAYIYSPQTWQADQMGIDFDLNRIFHNLSTAFNPSNPTYNWRPMPHLL
jgi:hypothetical protein